MATRRTGKPYIWVTWLAKLLGGDLCVWSAWFKAHYRYDKFEEQALDLAQWNREHTELMRERKLELEEAGYTVTTEAQNEFKIEGKVAVFAGKPDLVASMKENGGFTYVIDGKTGQRRDSDWWQVLIYLFALPKSRKDLIVGTLEGEIQYRRGDVRVPVYPADLTPERYHRLITLIETIGSATPPEKVPSRGECQRCNIGSTDCPQRVNEEKPVAVSDF